MADPVLNVFLSAVTKELGSYRAEVAKALREKGLHVKIQEDFNTGPGTLLEKLDAYIQQCHAVVCLMGDRYGAEPPEAERIKMGGQRHSYTQWEYLLARKRGKSIYIFRPALEETPRDPEHAANPEPDELPLLQSTFWQTQILDQGTDRTPFTNQTDLVRKVLICDFVEAKRKSEDRPLPPLNTTSPYVGLRRFEEKDKANFYGRTALIGHLLERSAATPLLLITGNSGSGKSSVVRAGMIPKWRTIHPRGQAIVCTPNVNPFEGLFIGLVAAGIDAEKAAFLKSPSPTIFRDLLARLEAGDRRLEGPWLIFVDQFEELFTRVPDKEKKLRETFIAALVDAANSGLPNLRIVLAMRDDFFGNLRDHEALFRITDKNLERVIAMKGPELREIIEEPAFSHGVRFQDGLVKSITESVEGRAGMLPLLQYTLEALWNQERSAPGGTSSRNVDIPVRDQKQPRSGTSTGGGLSDGVLSRRAYDAIGGVEGALQKRVTHFYNTKTVDQRRAVRNILLSLVEVNESSGDATTVSRAAPREALAQAGSEEILKELLNEEKLLISIGGEEEEPLVELAHEALIKGWEEFEAWVRESKEAIQMRNRLREDAKRWSVLRGKAAREELWQGSRLERAIELEKEGEFTRIGGLGDLERKFVDACQRERKSKVRRLQMAVAFTSLLSVVATFASLVAFAVSQIAQEQREEAEKQTRVARIQAGKANVLRGELLPPTSSNRNFYNARALGFEGLGKPHLAARDGGDRRAATAWFALREVRWHKRDAWNRTIGGTMITPEPNDEDDFPILLAGMEAKEEASAAYHAIAVAKPKPFLWTSPVAPERSGGSVYCVSWSPDGQTLASGSYDKWITLWDVASGKEKATLAGHSESVTSVSWSPDGQTLASGSRDNSIKLWDVASGKEKATLSGHSDSVNSVSWSPDGQTLASCSRDNTIKLWDVGSGKEKATLSGHSQVVTSVSWSPDGQTLASGSRDNSIKLWDVASGKEKATLAGHSQSVSSVAWSPDGQILASGSADNSIKLWNVGSGAEKATLTGHSQSVSSVAWSPDGQTLASASQDYEEPGEFKLWDVASGKEKATLAGHSEPITSVAWSPDGQTLASGSYDNTIKMWDVASGKEKATLAGHSESVTSVSWSPDGQTLASGSEDNRIKLWDVASGKEKETLEGLSGGLSLSWSPNGQTLASEFGHDIELWDVASGKVKVTLAGRSGRILSVSWSPDGQTLASGSYDKGITLWDAASGKEKVTLAGHRRPINSLSWSPDGQTLASGSDDEDIKLWDVATGKEKATLTGHAGPITSVAWSPDGRTLASGSYDNTIKMWDVASGKEKATLTGHWRPVKSVAWSPDGQTLASGSYDASIRLWNAGTGVEKATLAGHSGAVMSTTWSPDGQALASSSSDRTLRLWDVAGGHEKATLAGHTRAVNRVTWSPDGQTLASGSADNSIVLWETGTGKAKTPLAGHSNSVTSVAWSPDGQTLVSGSYDHRVKVWSVASRQEKATLVGESGEVGSVSWSPDGQTLASGSGDKSIKLWNAASGKETTILAGHLGWVSSVDWSPDGQTLASGSYDKCIKLWDAGTGKEKATLTGHSGWVSSVGWSPDGQTLASGSADKSIKLWDVATGKEKATLAGHWGPVNSVAWSPDGQTLASGSDDESIKLWEVVTGNEKATLAGHSGSVRSVAWSPDGQTLASGADDATVKLWEATLKVEIDLYLYLKEGSCRFDPKTENLEWNQPGPQLYWSRSPFRNVSRWSSLGIRQRKDLATDEVSWLLYIKVLEAENWHAMPIFQERLTAEQKQRPHAAVIWAIGTLADQSIDAAKAGMPIIARMRVQTALGCLSGLEPVQAEQFYVRLGKGCAEQVLERATVEPILMALPDDAARAAVSVAFFANALNGIDDFDAVVRQVSVAEKWGAVGAAAVFAQGDRVNLRNVINRALESHHADATAYALAASEALLKVDSAWDESYSLRGRALVKSGKPVEAIPFYEKALGMTADEDGKKEITTALEEARAVNAAGAATQPAPAPK